MDRNTACRICRQHVIVALRKESVDRNLIDEIQLEFNSVALRKESVDRNIIFRLSCGKILVSLSARRAWIEIFVVGFIAKNANSSLSARRAWIEIFLLVLVLGIPTVALRKESVDRNIFADRSKINKLVALRKESVDRNSDCSIFADVVSVVALRKESVDRNYKPVLLQRLEVCRSPQGERG